MTPEKRKSCDPAIKCRQAGIFHASFVVGPKCPTTSSTPATAVLPHRIPSHRTNYIETYQTQTVS